MADGSGKLTFEFDGKPVEARAGDTVASALYRAGQRIFTRSFKYHRPRGLLCLAGNCPNCMVNVDGVPNVRTCITPVREGHGGAAAERISVARERLAVRRRSASIGSCRWVGITRP